MAPFVGRTEELQRLEQLVEKSSASLVVVYGRRRIGKSGLIQHFAKNYRTLSFEGLSPRRTMTTQDQLNEFSRQLARQCKTAVGRFSDWGDAFHELSLHTETGRVIVVFDEISWMALEDTDFPGKLKIAWDNYFKKNSELILIVCGSVSAWIKRNIVNSTGFHGRISLKLNLKELPLDVCKKFWGLQAANVSDSEKLRLIAVTGGIPKYLEEINPKLTADENIRRMAFVEGGILFNDFNDIFTDTLLRKSDVYEKIVRLLCDGPIDSKDFSKKLNIPKGKYLSELLDELTIAGFLSKASSWKIKTGKMSAISQYRLSDNYLRFYLKYIEPNREQIIAGNFSGRSLSSLPGWASVMSLQIENLVLNNRAKIKALLNIKSDEVICDNSYLQRTTERHNGCQIDYLIQTKPDNLYLCEIKYSRAMLRASVVDEVKEKVSRLSLPRHISIRPVLIYLGEVHDEVIDSGYFVKLINLEELLSSGA